MVARNDDNSSSSDDDGDASISYSHQHRQDVVFIDNNDGRRHVDNVPEDDEEEDSDVGDGDTDSSDDGDDEDDESDSGDISVITEDAIEQVMSRSGSTDRDAVVAAVYYTGNIIASVNRFAPPDTPRNIWLAIQEINSRTTCTTDDAQWLSAELLRGYTVDYLVAAINSRTCAQLEHDLPGLTDTRPFFRLLRLCNNNYTEAVWFYSSTSRTIIRNASAATGTQYDEDEIMRAGFAAYIPFEVLFRRFLRARLEEAGLLSQ